MNIGSNSVENHPVSAKWLNKAHERGAKWIVVDPRYTRTAEMADIYCPIRSGTDIAFYGGLYNYIVENLIEPNLQKYLAGEEVPEYNFSYLLNYTNASYLLDPDYSFDPSTGLFSGWNEDTGTYDAHSWHYQVESESTWDTSGDYAWAVAPGVPEFTPPRRRASAPRHDAAGSDVRLPAVQEALRPLRHPHRLPHLRHGRGDPARGVRDLRLHGCSRQIRRHPVRARPDAAHLRRAEHPRDERPAAAARQRRSGRRRRGGAARRAQRPGRDRHGHARQRASRLPQVAQHDRPREPAQVAGRRDLLRRLLHQQAQVPHLEPQGMVRRRGHRGQRLRLRLVAQGPLCRGRSGLHAHLHLRADEAGRHQGLLLLGHEPVPFRPQRGQRAPLHGQPRLARRRRPGRDGGGLLLEGTRHERGRDRHDRLLPAVRPHLREARHHPQLRPLAAVALPGCRAVERGQARLRHRRQAVDLHRRSVQAGGRRQPRSHPQHQMGLLRRRQDRPEAGVVGAQRLPHRRFGLRTPRAPIPTSTS